MAPPVTPATHGSADAAMPARPAISGEQHAGDAPAPAAPTPALADLSTPVFASQSADQPQGRPVVRRLRASAVAPLAPLAPASADAMPQADLMPVGSPPVAAASRSSSVAAPSVAPHASSRPATAAADTAQAASIAPVRPRTVTTISAAAPVPTPFVAAAPHAGDDSMHTAQPHEASTSEQPPPTPISADPVVLPVRRVSLRARPPRALDPGSAPARATLVRASGAGVGVTPAAPHTSATTNLAAQGTREAATASAPLVAPLPATKAPADSVAVAARASPATGRPEPTRAALFAAFQKASPAPSAFSPAPPARAPSAAVARAAPLSPALTVARWAAPAPMATLARVQTATASGPSASSPQTSAGADAPDLDALTDHVLERLRHELRDGRERLGYLLDDLR